MRGSVRGERSHADVCNVLSMSTSIGPNTTCFQQELGNLFSASPLVIIGIVQNSGRRGSAREPDIGSGSWLLALTVLDSPLPRFPP